MALYSVYSISASIVQGIGNPKIPMYILITGCVVIFILGWHLIPKYGIVGGALATTLSSFMMTVLMFLIQFRLTKTKPPYQFMLKVLRISRIFFSASFILSLSIYVKGVDFLIHNDLAFIHSAEKQHGIVNGSCNLSINIYRKCCFFEGICP